MGKWKMREGFHTRVSIEVMVTNVEQVGLCITDLQDEDENDLLIKGETIHWS